jgi:hypothetical protein
LLQWKERTNQLHFFPSQLSRILTQTTRELQRPSYND